MGSETTTASPLATLRMSERELARLISRIEREDPDLTLEGLSTGDAQVIGVTGAPGSGKSTLVDVLAREIRKSGQTVAILAIDPSSHKTGGAVLGDRVRMSSHAQDSGIYIRSMGTRGSTTGLARAARGAVRALGAAGYDIVIVETVGVGQVELDVLTVADTVAVVLVPGMGDTMQMNKAGIMEIGDLYIVNMADRAETPGFVRDLKQALALGARQHRDLPPVCRTVALTGRGVAELWTSLTAVAHEQATSSARSERRRAQRSATLDSEIERCVLTKLRMGMRSSPSLAQLREQVIVGEISPQEAAKRWLVEVPVTLV